jgi:hypothetical protein
VEVDHVLIRVADLDDAARTFEARHGLASVPGGRHPGWGTANRIVPLGDTYLELVAVVDEREAAGSAFGRWAAESAPGPMGWCVRPPSLDDAVARLDLGVKEGSRATAAGGTLSWRFAGLEQSAAGSALPFFIEWVDASLFPGRIPVDHPDGPVRLAEVVVAGHADAIEQWLGADHGLPLAVRPGSPRIDGVVLAGPSGRRVLGR